MYRYYIVYSFGGGGMGSCTFDTAKKIKTYNDIKLIKSEIENYNKDTPQVQPPVIIINWKRIK